MATSGAIRAGKAYVEVGADSSALEKGLRDASAKTKAFGSSIMGIGAAVAGAGAAIASPFLIGLKGAMELEDSMAAAGVIFGDSADIIIKKSEEMASSGRAVQGEFLNAANSFGAAFKGAGSSQKEAAELGNQLAELGIDMASFGSGVSQAEAFTALQAALRGEFDPLERFTVFLSAAKVESKALAMGLSKTKGEIDDHAKKQATLALILEGTKDQQGDQVRSINSMKGIWTVLTNTLTNASVVLGQALAPTMISIGKYLVSVTKGTVGWLQANKGLLLTIATVAAGIVAAGAALIGLGAAIYGAGVAFGVLASVVAGVGAVLGVIFSPIGLIVVAVGGAVVAFFKFASAGQSLAATLKAGFGQILADAQYAFGGIADALSAGDITLAAQILWAFLKMEFQKGLNFLSSLWVGWSTAVMDIFAGLTGGIASFLIDAGAGMQEAFILAIGAIKGAWTAFSDWFANMWDNNVATTTKQIIDIGGMVEWNLAMIQSLFDGTAFTAEAHGKRMKAVLDDIAAKKANVDEDLKNKKDARAKAAAGIGEDTKGKIAAVEDDRKEQQKALKDQMKAEMDARRKAADDSLKAGKDKLQAATDGLANLVDDAVNEAAAEATSSGIWKPVQDVMDEAANEAAAAATSKDVQAPIASEMDDAANNVAAFLTSSGKWKPLADEMDDAANDVAAVATSSGEWVPLGDEMDDSANDVAAFMTSAGRWKSLAPEMGAAAQMTADDIAEATSSGTWQPIEVLDDALNEQLAAATSSGEWTPPGTDLGLDPAGLDQALAQTQSKIETTGSFSASALSGLGVGSDIGHEQLDEAKKQTKELEKLNKKQAVFT